MASSLTVTTGKFGWFRMISQEGRRARLPWLPIGIVSVMLVCALFAPLLAPKDPTTQSTLRSKG